MGCKRSPYLHQQAADPQPVGRSADWAADPRPGCDQLLPFVLLDLLLQLPDLTKRSLICWLQLLDLGGFISTGFQPL